MAGRTAGRIVVEVQRIEQVPIGAVCLRPLLRFKAVEQDATATIGVGEQRSCRAGLASEWMTIPLSSGSVSFAYFARTTPLKPGSVSKAGPLSNITTGDIGTPKLIGTSGCYISTRNSDPAQ
jgi:hypothetical protein